MQHKITTVKHEAREIAHNRFRLNMKVSQHLVMVPGEQVVAETVHLAVPGSLLAAAAAQLAVAGS